MLSIQEDTYDINDHTGKSHDNAGHNIVVEKYVEKKMKLSINDYTSSKDLEIWCGTFNVNNRCLREELSESLDNWILNRVQIQSSSESPTFSKTKFKKKSNNDNNDDYIYPPSHDILAFGFQEIVDLNTMNVVLDGNKTVKQYEYWRAMIEDTLSRKIARRYTLATGEKMVGVALFVFVASDLMEEVSDIRTCIAPIGILGVMGNKGACSARMCIFDTSVCFVSSHLSSGQSHVDHRNNDFFEINRKTVFPPSAVKDESDDENEDDSHHYHDGRDQGVDSGNSSGGNRKRTKSMTRGQKMWRRCAMSQYLALDIESHHAIFWMGDLNYRIANVDADDVEELALKGIFDRLKQNDQLAIELAKYRISNVIDNTGTSAPIVVEGQVVHETNDRSSVNSSSSTGISRSSSSSSSSSKHKVRVFEGYIEAPIHFKPTYKYEPGGEHYQRKGEQNKISRNPSWCDRILWKSTETLSITGSAGIKQRNIDDNQLLGSSSNSSTSNSADNNMITTHETNNEDLVVEDVRIRCTQYSDAPILFSDHRPVMATFSLRTDQIDLVKELQYFRDILYEISRWENDQIPKVQILRNHHISFDNARANRASRTCIKLKNIGNTVATWRFVSLQPIPSKPRYKPVFPEWVSCEPEMDLLMPEEAQEIQVTVTVSKEEASKALRHAERYLDTVLVLRVDSGRDFFIPIEVNTDSLSAVDSIDFGLLNLEKALLKEANIMGHEKESETQKENQKEIRVEQPPMPLPQSLSIRPPSNSVSPESPLSPVIEAHAVIASGIAIEAIDTAVATFEEKHSNINAPSDSSKSASASVSISVSRFSECSNSLCKCPDCTCGSGCTCGVSLEVVCDPCTEFKAKAKANAKSKMSPDSTYSGGSVIA